MEGALEKGAVVHPGQLAVHLVDAPHRPGMHRRIDVAEVPFVGRQLAVRVHVPLAQDQQQLPLGKFRVDQREGDGMERAVPGGEPRVLPLVGHRQHLGSVEVLPIRVARAAGRRLRRGRVALDGAAHVEEVGLLGPQHAGQRLALHQPGILVADIGLQRCIELVGIGDPLLEPVVEIQEGAAVALGRPQPKAQDRLLAGRELALEMRRALAAARQRGDSAAVAADHAIVDAVLERALVGQAVEPTDVGLVLAEQPRRRAVVDLEAQVGHPRVARQHRATLQRQPRPQRAVGPGPAVAGPELRQDVDRRRLGAAVDDGDADQRVVRRGLGVFDEHVEVTILGEHAGLRQLELRHVRPAMPVLVEQALIREGRLRILVEHPHVGMRRRAVEMVVHLLDVLAVVALAVGQAEQPLLEDRVPLVPQSEPETPVQPFVGPAGQAVLSPAVGPAAGVVVRECVPRVTVGAVILAHRAPLPVADIRAPASPSLAPRGGRQAEAFGGFEDRVPGHPG